MWKIAEFYEKARNVCDNYLEGKTGIEFSLVNQLFNMEFDSFLRKLKNVRPTTLQDIYDQNRSQEEEEDKDTDKEENNKITRINAIKYISRSK